MEIYSSLYNKILNLIIITFLLLFTSNAFSEEVSSCVEINIDLIDAINVSESMREIDQLVNLAVTTATVCGDDACKSQGLQSGNLNDNGTFGSSSGGTKYKTPRYKKKASKSTLNGAIKRSAYQDCKDAVANACSAFENMCGPNSDKPCKRDTSPSGEYSTRVGVNSPATESAKNHSSTVTCSGYCGC